MNGGWQIDGRRAIAKQQQLPAATQRQSLTYVSTYRRNQVGPVVPAAEKARSNQQQVGQSYHTYTVEYRVARMKNIFARICRVSALLYFTAYPILLDLPVHSNITLHKLTECAATERIVSIHTGVNSVDSTPTPLSSLLTRHPTLPSNRAGHLPMRPALPRSKPPHPAVWH